MGKGGRAKEVCSAGRSWSGCLIVTLITMYFCVDAFNPSIFSPASQNSIFPGSPRGDGSGSDP